MVVDDSDSMRRLYRTCLTSFGIANPRMFDCGLAALDAMSELAPDLVIVDWRMGPPSGLDFLRSMRCVDRAAACLTAAIMVTGHGSEAFVKRAMRAGAQQFLVKPVSPRLLFERIAWVTNDARELVRHGKRYVVEGIEERLKWYEKSVEEAVDTPVEVRDVIEL